eukprot:GHUV01023744.1.p1 GENE.GHUV01023744.1~~GHUV01023744.1.p1  ORF type:complete len:102 (-),score=9.25 GHUV01023744.1:947-1252(-)
MRHCSLIPYLSAALAQSHLQHATGSATTTTIFRPLQQTECPTFANATLLFCPPDNVYSGCSASGPLTPKRPRCCRASCSLRSGYALSMIVSGLRARSRPST